MHVATHGLPRASSSSCSFVYAPKASMLVQVDMVCLSAWLFSNPCSAGHRNAPILELVLLF